MPQVPPRRTRLRVVLPLLLVLAFALSGCVRVKAAMSVGSDDLVSGKVEVASLQVRTGDTGPQLTVPQDLIEKVRFTPYTADGYVGQTVDFEKLTFEEVKDLAAGISGLTSRYRLNFRRSGDIVSLAGSIDLTQLPPEKVDVQVKIAFPGTLGKTNGMAGADNTVLWNAKAGVITEFNATAQYNDDSGVSLTRWVVMVGAGAVGAALLVLVLALVAHRRSVRQHRQAQYTSDQQYV